MSSPINLEPTEIEQTAQTVASTITQAARPGPVPMSGAGSPVDAAASAVASAVVKNVAAASAELAPKGPEGLALTQAALTQAKTKDDENAGRIKAVGSDAQQPAQGRGDALSSPDDTIVGGDQSAGHIEPVDNEVGGPQPPPVPGGFPRPG
jgi:hypothetical protein